MQLCPPSTAVLAAVGLLAAGGCAGLSTVELKLPERYSLVREQLIIHSDFPLAAQHRLLEELTARRFDISRRLSLPVSDEPVHVFLFEDAGQFRTFIRMRYPEFPERRAFFVETDTRLIVYAHWGDRVAEDLRHEMAHAYLHSVVPNLPLWLDEGLAEFFEVPRGREGINREHLGRLLSRIRQGTWRPDPKRLERFRSAFDMSQDDYAEAWAWVHFLLQSRQGNADLLGVYLADLRRNGTTLPLSVRIKQAHDQPEAVLLAYVDQLAMRDAPPPGFRAASR